MARGAAAAVVIFLVGVLGLWAAFSDLSPNETLLQRVVVVALVYLLGGSFVGILLPRRWYLAALTAWGPVAIGL